MKASHIVTPALAAILLVACAGTHTSAPDRAQQAEADRERAQEQARDARRDADRARLQAEDATRAQREADQNAQWAAQRAAQAEHDAQIEARGGVAEAQVESLPPAPIPNTDVAFSTNSLDLSAEARAKLDDIARGMRAHPSRTLVIEGYADDTGATATDLRTSRQRAEAVARYLESDGVSRDRITTKGYGPRNPAYNDATVPGRRIHNRRVAIIIEPDR